MTYYIIEATYAGVNADQHIDDDRIIITTEAPSSLELSCILNDWRRVMHAQAETLDDARSIVTGLDEFVRDRDANDIEFLRDCDIYEGVVAIYKRGRYDPMSRQEAADWLVASMERDITADATPEQMAELLEGYAAEANYQGYELHRDALDLMQEYRASLSGE